MQRRMFFEKRKNRELGESYINPDNIAIKNKRLRWLGLIRRNHEKTRWERT